MTDRNEIDELIDGMIDTEGRLAGSLRGVLPKPLAESVALFHESNVTGLKRLRDFFKRIA